MVDEEELERVRRIRSEHEAEILAKANVVGVGIGLSSAPEEMGSEVVIVVSVTHKVPTAQLNASDRVPRELDGVPVEVRAVGQVRAA
jgi:hypothetical protein